MPVQRWLLRQRDDVHRLPDVLPLCHTLISLPRQLSRRHVHMPVQRWLLRQRDDLHRLPDVLPLCHTLISLPRQLT